MQEPLQTYKKIVFGIGGSGGGVSIPFQLINIRFQVVKRVDSFWIFNNGDVTAIKSVLKLLLSLIKLP